MKTVTIRKRKNKNFISLYLDVYVDGQRSYPNLLDAEGNPLRLILTPKNQQEKDYNKKVNDEAKRQKNLLEADLLAGKFNNIVVAELKNANFIAYFAGLCEGKHSSWKESLNVTTKFITDLPFSEISEKIITDLKMHFIRHYPSMHSAKTRFGIVRRVLRMAYADGLLDKDFSAKIKNVVAEASDKPYLEPHEIQRLVTIPTKSKYHIREAALFAYYTGLRVSDLLGLKYEHLIGEKYNVIQKVIFKNRHKKKKATLTPIPDPALPIIVSCIRDLFIDKNLPIWDLMPKIKKDEFVFWLGQGKSKKPGVYVTRAIKRYAERLGIDKKIGIHTFRYSHATELEANEADRKIIQDNLGHASGITTNIYAKKKISKQIEAVNKKIRVISLDTNSVVKEKEEHLLVLEKIEHWEQWLADHEEYVACIVFQTIDNAMPHLKNEETPSLLSEYVYRHWDSYLAPKIAEEIGKLYPQSLRLLEKPYGLIEGEVYEYLQNGNSKKRWVRGVKHLAIQYFLSQIK